MEVTEEMSIKHLCHLAFPATGQTRPGLGGHPDKSLSLSGQLEA